MANHLKENLEINDPLKKAIDKLKKGQINTPTISTPYITEPTAPPQQAPTEPIKTDTTLKASTEPTEQKKASTTKGLKAEYTRHTFEIKKDNLKLLQALAKYRNLKISDTINDLLDFAFKSIDEETKQKALANNSDGRIKLI